jgi:ABC-type bacteriocin/lantibiotic exporter with double-glycine peptidase domain
VNNIKKIVFIEQMEKNECGYACLAMLMNYYEYNISISDLREKFGSVKRGISFANMLTICKEYCIRANAYKMNFQDVCKIKEPCIIQWSQNTHFVILQKISKAYAYIMDPGMGEVKIPIQEFKAEFANNIFVIESINEDKKIKRESKIIKKFIDIVCTNMDLFGYMTIFSFLVLIASVIPIFILGKLIDQLLEHNLLSSKLIGYAIIMPVLFYFLHYIREQIAVALANRVDFRLTSHYFNHFLKIPLSFLENRKKGDLINRFYMLNQLRDFFTSQAITLLLNLLMIITYLIFVMKYSFQLGLIIIMWICIVILLLTAHVNISYNLSKKTLLSQIKIQNLITETTNLIHDIKIYSLENTTYNKWEKEFTDFLKIRISNGKIKSGISALITALQVFQGFIIFLIGSKYVMDNSMSFGVLYYIMMIANIIAEPIFSSCSIYMSFVNTSTLFQRINDIDSIKIESKIISNQDLHYNLRGKIEFRNVSFQYSKFDALILDHVSFIIKPGEAVFLKGISGVGKSTIIKLILGVYKAIDGTILIDDKPLEEYDINTLRRSISVVQQDGLLFNSTILENIVLNEKFNEEKFKEIILKSDLKNLILQLPQQENTVIFENGIDFSQGQRQRILMARAMYKESKIFILDEATNFLHNESEYTILNNILSMQCSKLVISHKYNNLFFDKILQLDHGNIMVSENKEPLSKISAPTL